MQSRIDPCRSPFVGWRELASSLYDSDSTLKCPLSKEPACHGRAREARSLHAGCICQKAGPCAEDRGTCYGGIHYGELCRSNHSKCDGVSAMLDHRAAASRRRTRRFLHSALTIGRFPTPPRVS